MKRFNSIVFSLTALCAFATSVHANILVNDTWADGDRTSGTPGAGGDSPWYAAAATTATVPAAGDLRFTSAGNALGVTYFAPAGSPVTLGDGESLSVTWVFSPTTLAAANTSQGFNVAIANSPAHASADGSTASQQQAYTGYAQFMNMSSTLNAAAPFSLKEWVAAGAGSLLGTAGNWGANGAAGTLASAGTTGAVGFSSGTTYTYVMTLLRSGTALNITSTLSGAGLNGTGSESISYTDATPNGNSFSFDTFEFRSNASSQTAAQFDISLFKAEYFPVPEPCTFAVAGLGVLGLVMARRMRR